jgi:tetratricopeptide (TPR) repeat protein
MKSSEYQEALRCYSKAIEMNSHNLAALNNRAQVYLNLSRFVDAGKLLLIYMCNFHVLCNLLLIYICKLHWNRHTSERDASAVLAFCGRGNFLLIYICNFHVLNHLLLIYICKLHWNLNTMLVCQVNYL